jgi:hypothetical protein
MGGETRKLKVGRFTLLFISGTQGTFLRLRL